MRPDPPAKRRAVHVFALQAALGVALLAWLPGTEALYPRLFHTQANWLFQSFGERRAVRLTEPGPGQRRSDTRMTGFAQRRIEPRWTAHFRIHDRGYWPLAGVLALCLATPLPLRRRIGAALLGAVLIDAFTLAQVAAVAWTSFGMADATPAAGAGWARAARTAREFFNAELPRAVATLLVWAIAARPGRVLDLRSARTQWREWRARRGAAERSGSG